MELVELSENQLQEVDGGGLVAGVVGGIFGFTAGTVIVAGEAIAGHATPNVVWKTLVASTLFGAACGAVIPEP